MKPACVEQYTMCSADWSSLIVTTPKHAISYGTASRRPSHRRNSYRRVPPEIDRTDPTTAARVSRSFWQPCPGFPREPNWLPGCAAPAHLLPLAPGCTSAAHPTHLARGCATVAHPRRSIRRPVLRRLSVPKPNRMKNVCEKEIEQCYGSWRPWYGRVDWGRHRLLGRVLVGCGRLGDVVGLRWQHSRPWRSLIRFGHDL